MKDCKNCISYKTCFIPRSIYSIINDGIKLDILQENPLKVGLLNIMAESCKGYKLLK